MGGISSGRHPHWGGGLKQVAIKFPTKNDYFLLAKRICYYREISFSEWVRELVRKEVQQFKYTKMWPCECTDSRGKVQINFKRKHYCNECGQYQTKHHESLYNKS
jgi:hypothetical protein